MKTIQSIALVLLCLGVSPMARTQSNYPWNPDFDADGVVGVNDLLALLAVFESEFEAQLAFTDSSKRRDRLSNLISVTL